LNWNERTPFLNWRRKLKKIGLVGSIKLTEANLAQNVINY